MEEWDDSILSELSDLSFDLPPFEFEDDDEEEGECSSDDVKLDEAIIPSLMKKKRLEVLIDIGEDHKKVVTLENERDDLSKAFFRVISNDPALNEFVGLQVTFKVFNEKFNTWVDHETSTGITDGMHLKAVFQKKCVPNNISRRRHKSSRKRYYSDSSDDFLYEKEFVKYRKLRKIHYNSGKSTGSSNRELIHNKSDDFKSEENCGEFRTSQFDKCQNESISYKFQCATKHVEDDQNYEEGEEGDGTKESRNVLISIEKQRFLQDGMHLETVFQKKCLPKNNTSHHRHKSSRKRYSCDSSDDCLYEKELVKYRKLRKRNYNSDKSSGSKNHELIHKKSGEDFKSEEDNNCEFRTSQFYKCQNASISYKFRHATRLVEDDENYQEEECYDEDADAAKESRNVLRSLEKHNFSQGDLYRMSLGLTNKNPVSALHELCQRLKWESPEFELVKQSFVNSEHHFWMKGQLREQVKN